MKKNYFILFLGLILSSSQLFSQCNGFALGQGACSSGCTGSATAFGYGGTAPYVYLWSSGATTSSATNLCVATYTVIISDNVGCTVSKTASVTVQPPPSISVTPMDATCSTCADGQAYVTAVGTGPFSYTWSPNTSINDTAFSLTPGVYTVCVTNLLTSCDSCSTVTVGYLSGIKNYSAINNYLNIFPNPVTDLANIQFNAGVSGKAILSIVNILGEVVYSEKTELKINETKKLDMTALTSGIYFINVYNADFSIRQKIIKE